MLIEIILPAGKFPEGATVRKVTGEARYVLRDSLEVRGSKAPPIRLDGCRILVDPKDGCGWAIPSDRKIVGIFDDADALIDFLQEDR